MRFVFLQWRRPRHPLLQLLLGLAALGLLLFFGLFALFAAAGFLVVLGLLRAWRALTGRGPAPAARAAPSGVIEGEFSVVREDSAHADVNRVHYVP